MKRQLIVHPFLFAIFPVLSLFSHNTGEVSFSEIILPTLILLMLAIVLLAVFTFTLGNTAKAAIVTSVFFLLACSYMHIYHLTDWRIGGCMIGRHRYLMPAWLLVFGCCAYFIKITNKNLINSTRILNILGAFLVIIPLVAIVSYKFKTKNVAWDVRTMEEIETGKGYYGTSHTLRDIYYIILDRYPCASTLRRIWNFDNTDFLDYLTDRGFYVASESRSNYLKTAHSLASSLNMDFINYLSDQLGEESNDWLPLYQMLQDYRVWRFLKQKGYKYMHFGSWWGPTSRNKHADINFRLGRVPEFSSMLFRSTIFFPIAVALGMDDRREEIRKRVLYKFDELGKIPQIDEPTFVFAHMLIPHSPYVFDRQGNFLTEAQVNKRSRRENYIDQLVFTNIKLKALVDKLISGSNVQPIIILQGDEGTFPERYRREGESFNWKRATEEELKEKMGILNAYYLPNRDKSVLHSSITPANSFRLVFNLYFGANLELLPDESYAFEDERHLYNFFNVTDRVCRESRE